MAVNTHDEIYGVVQRQTKKTDYTGLDTKTASVTVDNTNRTISVDVDLHSTLGYTQNTAYPGFEGQLNRELIAELQENLSAEVTRATQAEDNLDKKIDKKLFPIHEVHEQLYDAITAEQQRAVRAEDELSSKISSTLRLLAGTTDNLQEKIDTVNTNLLNINEETVAQIDNVNNRLTRRLDYLEGSVNSSLTSQNKQLVAAVSQLESKDNLLEDLVYDTADTIRAEVTDATNNVNSRIDILEENLDYEITYLDTRVTRQYADLSTRVSDVETSTQEVVGNIVEEHEAFEEYTMDALNKLDDSLGILEAKVSAVDRNLQEQIHLTVASVGAAEEHIDNVESAHNTLSERFSLFTNAANSNFTTINGVLGVHDANIKVNAQNIKNLQDTYATTEYVTEAITKYSSMSKQLAEAVDTTNCTVTIKGEIKPPVTGVIYLVPFDDTSNDYKQYTLIENQLLFIGATGMNLEGYATEEYVQRMIPDVSSFLAEIPEEYVTESELEPLLLTKNFATKTDISTEITNLLNQIEFIDGGTASSIST